MPRLSSGLRSYTFQLLPSDNAIAERLAVFLGLRTDGKPSRSAAIRYVLREAGKRLDRKEARKPQTTGAR